MSLEPEPEEQEPSSRRGSLVAMLVIVAIMLGVLYLTRVLSGVSRTQDCVMAGRQNCAPINPG